MVAITVAVASTIYVYMSGMGGTSPEKTPIIIFQQSDADDYLMVTGTGGQKGLNWENVILTVTGACNFINVSWPSAPPWIAAYCENCTNPCPAGDITSADRITFDFSTDSIEVTMVWEPTNGLIGSWKFT